MWAHDDLLRECGPGSLYSQLTPQQKMAKCKIRREHQVQRWFEYDRLLNTSSIQNANINSAGNISKILQQQAIDMGGESGSSLNHPNNSNNNQNMSGTIFQNNNADIFPTSFRYHRPRRKIKRKPLPVHKAIEASKDGVSFQPNIALLDAVNRGDYNEVNYMLQNGADPNAADEDGLTALHQACIDNCEDIVRLLLENGSNVDCRDSEDWTPLHACTTCGHQNIAALLLEYGANILALNADLSMPYDICEDDSPMLEFIERAMEKRQITQDQINQIRALPEQRIIDDIQREFMASQVQNSNRPGQYPTQNYPLNRNSSNHGGRPFEDPMNRTTSAGANSTIMAINNIAMKNSLAGSGIHRSNTTANSYAGPNKQYLMANRSVPGGISNQGFLEENDGSSNNIQNQNYSTSALNTFNVNEPLTNNSDGCTLLHVAAANDYVTLCRYLLEDLNANPNVQDYDGWTPAHAACCWSHRDILQLLIEFGADFNIENNLTEKPLDVTEEQDLLIFISTLLREQKTREKKMRNIERQREEQMMRQRQVEERKREEMEQQRLAMEQQRRFVTQANDYSQHSDSQTPNIMNHPGTHSASNINQAQYSFTRSTGSRRSARSQSFRRRSLRKQTSQIGQLGLHPGTNPGSHINGPILAPSDPLTGPNSELMEPLAHETEAKHEAAFWRGEITKADQIENVVDNYVHPAHHQNSLRHKKSYQNNNSSNELNHSKSMRKDQTDGLHIHVNPNAQVNNNRNSNRIVKSNSINERNSRVHSMKQGNSNLNNSSGDYQDDRRGRRARLDVISNPMHANSNTADHQSPSRNSNAISHQPGHSQNPSQGQLSRINSTARKSLNSSPVHNINNTTIQVNTNAINNTQLHLQHQNSVIRNQSLSPTPNNQGNANNQLGGVTVNVNVNQNNMNQNNVMQMNNGQFTNEGKRRAEKKSVCCNIL